MAPQGVPGSAEMLEQLANDVREIRCALEDARTNTRRQPLTSEAACNAALDRLYRLEQRFPQLQEMLRRRDKAKQQQTTDQRIKALEQRVAEQQRDLDALRKTLDELSANYFRRGRDAG